MTQARLVIIHDTDADGTASEWLLKRHIGVQYLETLSIPQRAGDDNIPEGLKPEDDVILVDRTYPFGTLLLMRHLVNSVTVIDHHKSRKDEYAEEPVVNSDAVSALDLSPSKIYFEYENINVLVDTSHSACMLSHFFCIEHADNVLVTPYWFISYIEDRDMWWFKLPYSKEVNAALHSACHGVPYDQLFNLLVQCDPFVVPHSYMEMGRTIINTQLNIIKSIAHGPTVLWYNAGWHFPPGSTINNMVIDNNSVWAIAPCPFTLISDMGSYMLNHTEEGYTTPNTVICYNMLKDITDSGHHKYVYSIRSKNDMLWLAKYYGGGGHPNACGFTSRIPPDRIIMLNATINQ